MPIAASAVSISRSSSFSPSAAPPPSSRGRSLKQSQGALFASIERRYGVPPGPLLAIWGMETGFGSQRGNQNMLSSIATLAYDCRRTAYFTEHLYAALQLIDRGALSPNQRGSMHGEVGQTQFMPKAILAYGTGNLENAANALNSTANFLRAHGWRAGAGYQPGEPNFAAIQAWNAAGVYQKAIARMGRQIDGGGGVVSLSRHARALTAVRPGNARRTSSSGWRQPARVSPGRAGCWLASRLCHSAATLRCVSGMIRQWPWLSKPQNLADASPRTRAKAWLIASRHSITCPTSCRRV